MFCDAETGDLGLKMGFLVLVMDGILGGEEGVGMEIMRMSVR